MTHRLRICALASVVALVALAGASGCNRLIPPSATPVSPAASQQSEVPTGTSLGVVEVDDYKGQRLDTVASEPDNSIKGPQNVDKASYRLKISGLVTNRECFLTGITGGEHLWNDSEKFGRVRKITTPDATHPTSGWYVEGNERSDVDGGHAYVTASCVDFPSLALLWDTPKEAPAGGAAVTVPITTGGGVKACGLRTIRGAFNKNSWTDGVRITPPSSATGTWNMTVSAGKFGRAVCVL